MNEDNVIDGVINYLKSDLQKRGRKFVVDKRAQAKDNDHGIDLRGHALSNGKWSTRYYVEAKGTRKVGDNSEKSSPFEYEFRWAVSQIVLQMKEFSSATNYGIAIPMTEKKTALRLMKNNKGLKSLKIRLYLAYKADNGEYFAQELTPKDVYKC